MVDRFEICSKKHCTGCGACVQVCAKGCISMEIDSEGFLYPIIDYSQCVSCNKCLKTCPQNSSVAKFDSTFYMVWHKSREILLKSSSGGVFTAFAEYVLAKKGVVYGVAHHPQAVYAFHVAVENANELDKLRKSKYYQSDTLLVFQEVRDHLRNGRWVLFTGTACQIAGLLNVLGNADKSKLLTMDVLCHGVTSSKVIKYYLTDMERIIGKKVTDFDFRIKIPKCGWTKSSKMRLHLSDNQCYVSDYDSDLFFSGFNENLFLRESCYNCFYCGRQRISDFTAADFWGIDSQSVTKEQLYNGISLLLVNSEKGNAIVQKLGQVMHIKPVDADTLIPRTSLALRHPCKRPQQRDIIFQNFAQYGYEATLKKLIPRHFAQVRQKKLFQFFIGERGYTWLKSVMGR